MKAATTWFVIADGSRARILKKEGTSGQVVGAFDHDFAAPHLATRDLVTDRPGRGRAGGPVALHGYAPQSDPHRLEKEAFARDVASVVGAAAHRNAFDRLILVAPARVLGVFRRALDKAARGRLTAEIGKDLSKVPMHDLPRHLAQMQAG